MSQDRKHRERQQELKEKMKLLQEEKRQKELKKREEELRLKREEEERQQRKKEQQQKRQAEQKLKLKQFQEKQEEEKIARQQEELRKKQELEKNKQQEIQNFMKIQKQKLTEEFSKEKVKKEQMEKEFIEQENKKIQDQERRKIQMEQQLNKDKYKRDQEQEFKQELDNLYHSTSIQNTFQGYDTNLKTIFDHYIEYNDFKLSKVDREHIQLKGIVQFCQQTNIYPNLVHMDEIQNIYKQHQKENSEATDGLNYGQFQQMLLKITVKYRSGFEELTNQFTNNGQNDQQQMLDIVQKNKSQQNDLDNLLQEINQTNGESIEGLFIYLNFPQDKNALYAKLRALKTSKDYVNTVLKDKNKNKK